MKGVNSSSITLLNHTIDNSIDDLKGLILLLLNDYRDVHKRSERFNLIIGLKINLSLNTS